jgi:hypothetical protein
LVVPPGKEHLQHPQNSQLMHAMEVENAGYPCVFERIAKVCAGNAHSG